MRVEGARILIRPPVQDGQLCHIQFLTMPSAQDGPFCHVYFLGSDFTIIDVPDGTLAFIDCGFEKCSFNKSFQSLTKMSAGSFGVYFESNCLFAKETEQGALS